MSGVLKVKVNGQWEEVWSGAAPTPVTPTGPTNLTAAVFGASAPHDLAALKADPILGDGHYAGVPFDPWTYVILLDGTQAFYDDQHSVWVQGAAPPRAPYSGAVVADLATLREMVGAMSTQDDPNLQRALDTAAEWVYERTMRCDWDHGDVQMAILLLANRMYSRRRSPEGVAGFGSEGFVTRVLISDPDINRLLERHLEMANVGIG